jgi:Holliday junction resolvase
MAMTPEKKVKNKVMKLLKEHGAYSFYASTGGYGKSGVPDIICCYKGHFLAIECKAGKNKPTALQVINLDAITASGGTAVVINETNIELLIDILQTLTTNSI